MSRPPSCRRARRRPRRPRDCSTRSRPRYDLVNRVMTFGMDVGWRRRAVRELRLPGRAPRARSGLRHRGSVPRARACAATSRSAFDFSFGMLANARTDAPLVQADILRLPVRDGGADGVTCGFALRNVVSLEALFAELARVVRPGGARRAARREPSRTTRVLRAGHARVLRARRADDRRRSCPTATRTPTCRVRWRTCRRPRRCSRMLRAAGFPSARRLQLSGGLTQLFVGSRA